MTDKDLWVARAGTIETEIIEAVREETVRGTLEVRAGIIGRTGEARAETARETLEAKEEIIEITGEARAETIAVPWIFLRLPL